LCSLRAVKGKNPVFKEKGNMQNRIAEHVKKERKKERKKEI